MEGVVLWCLLLPRVAMLLMQYPCLCGDCARGGQARHASLATNTPLANGCPMLAHSGHSLESHFTALLLTVASEPCFPCTEGPWEGAQMELRYLLSASLEGETAGHRGRYMSGARFV